MGSINFVTSEYITLAYEPLELDSYLKDPNFLEWAENIVMSDKGSSSLEAAQSIIDNYAFEFYKIHIVPGHEESYSIEIENCLPSYFDDYHEKKEAQKEVTRIKECLYRLVKECFFRECFPHWFTCYSNEKESIEGIEQAIKLMRKEIAITETERQINKRRGL